MPLSQLSLFTPNHSFFILARMAKDCDQYPKIVFFGFLESSLRIGLVSGIMIEVLFRRYYEIRNRDGDLLSEGYGIAGKGDNIKKKTSQTTLQFTMI